MRRLMSSVAIAACVLGACKKTSNPEPGAAKTAESDPCAKAKVEGPLAWIHDDFASALACAKAKQLPLVIDLWAPWCHTCLSMQSTVFVDPSFAADAPKFVFVALDTDRDVNASAVAKFPPSAWPTFYVVSPEEAVLARFVGAASVAQFHTFLDAGARAMAGGASGPDERLLAAERAITAKDYETAVLQLANAIAAAPPAWPRKPDALVSLIALQRKRKSYSDCLSTAETFLDDTGSAASATDFMAQAMGCADEHVKIAKDSPEQIARVAKLRERAIARWQKLVDDLAAPLSLDDRSDALAYLRDALITVDKVPEAKAVAEKQRALLDDAAATAATPMAAMTFNWQRAEVYVYLGRPLDIVPALEKSAADLPTEYDPPARLGWVLMKAGKLDDAAKWTDKSIQLAYGPRKARVLNQRAEISARQGDKTGERRFRADIVKLYESLPAGQVTPETIARAKQAVADLDPATAGSGSAR
jgi:thioredoxin-like negative regulator of GroEL